MPSKISRARGLEDRISYRCNMVSARISRFLTPMLEHHGLTVITWRVMAVIAHFGPLSAKQVAGRTSTDAFFVSRAIDQLVKLDLVRRETDPGDRRKLLLSLTAKGERVHERIARGVNAVEDHVLANFDGSERKVVSDALHLLMASTERLHEGELDWRDFC